MKAIFHINPLFSIEGEGGTQKEVFEQIAKLVEVFSIDTCGLCGKHNLQPIVRNNDEGHTFYEMKCLDCFARIAYGQKTQGSELYPRRTYNKKSPEVKAKKVAAGAKLPDGGWFRWTPSADQASAEE